MSITSDAQDKEGCPALKRESFQRSTGHSINQVDQYIHWLQKITKVLQASLKDACLVWQSVVRGWFGHWSSIFTREMRTTKYLFLGGFVSTHNMYRKGTIQTHFLRGNSALWFLYSSSISVMVRLAVSGKYKYTAKVATNTIPAKNPKHPETRYTEMSALELWCMLFESSKTYLTMMLQRHVERWRQQS